MTSLGYQEGVGGPREAIARIIAEHLGDTYDCTRVWEAWSVGTMTEDDFEPAAERAHEIADAIIALLPHGALVEALRAALSFLECAPLESGVCCCGSPVEGHGYGDGHSPVDDLAYHAGQIAESIRAALSKSESV